MARLGATRGGGQVARGILQSCRKREKARAVFGGRRSSWAGAGARAGVGARPRGGHRQRQIRMQIVREKNEEQQKKIVEANMSWQNPEFRVGNNERPGQEKLLAKDEELKHTPPPNPLLMCEFEHKCKQ